MTFYSLKHALAAASFGLAVSAHAEANALPSVPEHKACAQLQQTPSTAASTDIQALWDTIRTLIEDCYKYGSPEAQHEAEDWLTGPYLNVEDSPLLQGVQRPYFKFAVLAKAAWLAWPEDNRHRLLNVAADLLRTVRAERLDAFSNNAEFLIGMATEDSLRVEGKDFILYRHGAPDVIEKLLRLASENVEEHYDFTIAMYRAALARMQMALDPNLYNERSGKLIGWAQAWKDTQPEKSLDALGYFSLVGLHGTPSEQEDRVGTAFKDLVGIFEGKKDYEGAFDALFQLGDFYFDGSDVPPDVETFMVNRLPAILERHPINDQFIENLGILSNPEYGGFKFSTALMQQCAQRLQAIENQKLPTPQP